MTGIEVGRRYILPTRPTRSGALQDVHVANYRACWLGGCRPGEELSVFSSTTCSTDPSPLCMLPNNPTRQVTLADGGTGLTCPAALGYSFAAGCTDGTGAFNFVQGDTSGNAFWDLVSGILKDPSPQQEACQAPKPILLDTGEVATALPLPPPYQCCHTLQFLCTLWEFCSLQNLESGHFFFLNIPISCEIFGHLMASIHILEFTFLACGNPLSSSLRADPPSPRVAPRRGGHPAPGPGRLHHRGGAGGVLHHGRQVGSAGRHLTIQDVPTGLSLHFLPDCRRIRETIQLAAEETLGATSSDVEVGVTFFLFFSFLVLHSLT